MADQSRLTWALVISLLLHGLLLALLPVLRRANLALPSVPKFIDVDVVPQPPPRRVGSRPPPPAAQAPQAAPPPLVMPERQIVSPPDAGEEKLPPNARLLSDRDNTVKEETIHRGGGGGERAEPEPKPPAEEKDTAAAKEKPVAAPQERPAPPRSAEAKPERRPPHRSTAEESRQDRTQIASLPKLDQLLPGPGDLAHADVTRPSQAAAPAESMQHGPVNRNLLAGQGAFAAPPGINDYLPTVRESDVTLLNTKAEKFAPFVRRVATRVFQHLEINLKHAARQGAIGSGREYAQVEAIMSKDGRLLGTRVIERQGDTNLAAYRELVNAAQPDVFFDANPPAGAEASDGKIHFLLLVDLMVQGGRDPRTGAPAVGYYGVAGVGLQ